MTVQEADAAEKALYRQYRHTLKRFENALRITRDLNDRDRTVAAHMLDHVNVDTYRNSGALVCWVGVETLSLELLGRAVPDGKEVDRSRVQRAQKALRKAGILVVLEEGGGRAKGTTHSFSLDWLERFAVEAESWASSRLLKKLRPLFSDRSATVSHVRPPQVRPYSGRSATLLRPLDPDDSATATLSVAVLGSDTVASFSQPPYSGTGATLFAEEDGASSTVSDQEAVVADHPLSRASTGATVSAHIATTSQHVAKPCEAAATRTGQNNPENVDKGSWPVDNKGAAVDKSPEAPGNFGQKSRTDDLKTVAPVPPESKESKINKTSAGDPPQPPRTRPFQKPLFLPFKGGRTLNAGPGDAVPATDSSPTADEGRSVGLCRTPASDGLSLVPAQKIGQGRAHQPGKMPVEEAVKRAKQIARAAASVQNDKRFDHLRTQAAKWLGDQRLANLAISVMNDEMKSRIRRGHWPPSSAIEQEILRSAEEVRIHLRPSEAFTVDHPDNSSQSPSPQNPSPSPEPDWISADSGEGPPSQDRAPPDPRPVRTYDDRLERMASEALQQAGEATRGFLALQAQIGDMARLLQRLLGEDSKNSAVA